MHNVGFQPIQDNIIKSGSSRDLRVRPVMSEVCKILNECTSKGAEGCDTASPRTSALDSRRSKSLVLLPEDDFKRLYRMAKV